MIDLKVLLEKACNLRFTDAEVAWEFLQQTAMVESVEELRSLEEFVRKYRPGLFTILSASLSNWKKLMCQCAHHQQVRPVPNGQHLPEIEREIEAGRQIGQWQESEDEHY
jgi:hypothetical protein